MCSWHKDQHLIATFQPTKCQSTVQNQYRTSKVIDTKLLLNHLFSLRSDRSSAASPRMLAEFARSACCFSIPVFGVTGVTVIWLQTRSHHPYRGESGLDLSPFIIWQMTKSASQFDLAPRKPRFSCCQLTTLLLCLLLEYKRVIMTTVAVNDKLLDEYYTRRTKSSKVAVRISRVTIKLSSLLC